MTRQDAEGRPPGGWLPDQKLTLEEMNGLVDQLFATAKPQGDPHGRPVFLRLSLDELHRRFGRSS